MSSPARKEAESEFDNLLGNLVDELAMTPPSQSAVSLIPEPPKARVESTNTMAAQAAAAAGATATPVDAKPDNTVKIVGIIAGSLSAVAVAALLVLGGGFGEEPSEPAAVADDGAAERLAVAEVAGADAEQAFRDALAANKAEVESAAAADAEAAAKAKAEAEAAAEAAKKPKTTRRPKRPKQPKKPNKPKDDFDEL